MDKSTLIFSSCVFYLKRWIPESARWLLANGREEEAQKYLIQCAKMNGKHSSTHKLDTEVNISNYPLSYYYDNQF